MKKIISLVLCVVMLFAIGAPVLSASYHYNYTFPIIHINGDGTSIVDENDKEIFQIKKLGEMLTSNSDSDGDTLKDSIKNVLVPFLTKGLLFNDWDDYYKNLEKEISDIFGDVALDENGNAKNGTGISKNNKNANNSAMNSKKPGEVTFYYDWRLDPMEVADELDAFINTILESTGCKQVGIEATCLGTSVLFSYIAKYGADKLHGIGIDATIANGGEFISESLSGKFNVDGKAISRILKDADTLGYINIDDFLLESVSLAADLGLIHTLTDTVKYTIYERVVEGVTSSLALGTFFTMPCYWTAVTTEDYETAKNYVFGPEGSEKREKYAVLIEKLDNYDIEVRREIGEGGKIWQELKDKGVNIGIVSKYGFQMVPICESKNLVADQYASVKNSSFGATTSTIYDTLSDEYIAQQIAAGKEKYISPDHQIDASTCMFPEYTWFTKGASHSNRTNAEDEILIGVIIADRQLTIEDFPQYTQFMVYSDEAPSKMVPMTSENCYNEFWRSDIESEKTLNPIEKLIIMIKRLYNWLKEVFVRINSGSENDQ